MSARVCVVNPMTSTTPLLKNVVAMSMTRCLAICHCLSAMMAAYIENVFVVGDGASPEARVGVRKVQDRLLEQLCDELRQLGVDVTDVFDSRG